MCEYVFGVLVWMAFTFGSDCVCVCFLFSFMSPYVSVCGLWRLGTAFLTSAQLTRLIGWGRNKAICVTGLILSVGLARPSGSWVWQINLSLRADPLSVGNSNRLRLLPGWPDGAREAGAGRGGPRVGEWRLRTTSLLCTSLSFSRSGVRRDAVLHSD